MTDRQVSTVISRCTGNFRLVHLNSWKGDMNEIHVILQHNVKGIFLVHPNQSYCFVNTICLSCLLSVQDMLLHI